MSVFSKCIKADLELVSADKRSAIARWYLRARHRAQRLVGFAGVSFPLVLCPFHDRGLDEPGSPAAAWVAAALHVSWVLLVPGKPCRIW